MLRSLALLFTLLLLVAGCGSGSGQAEGSSGESLTTLSLQLDWYPNPDHVGLYTAIDRGFFQKAGLRVEPHQPSDVSDPIKLVATGRADVGISYEPELFFAQQQHAPVVAVCALVPEALNSIIARTDAGIHTVADLRGKTIGEDGTQSTAAYLDTVLRSAGIDPHKDVHRVTVGFNLLPALLSKKVDAVIGVFRNIEGAELTARGVPHVTFPVDQYGVPSYDELVIVANSQRLASDPGYKASVRAFVAALMAGTAYAEARPQAAIAVMHRYAADDYRSVLERSVPATLALLHTTKLDPVQWDAFGRWMQAQGLLKQPPDGAKLVASP
jgi:putative hydroxymethylpyrimidine transport system substrate-binding protein